MEVLLLTENVLAEEKLQNNIQQLGHEVFVNKSFLYNISNIFYFNYDVCIFSNTIPKSKVRKIVANAMKGTAGLVFVCESFFGRENTSILEEIWITQDEPLEDLKEKLEVSNDKAKIDLNQREIKKIEQEVIPIADLHLSMNEQRVFSLLTTNENHVLSREEICEHVWDQNYTDSRKSQLSLLIKRINEKLKVSSLSSHEIKTLWGKGYAFSKVNPETQ